MRFRLRAPDGKPPQPITTLICLGSIVVWGSIVLAGGLDKPGVAARWGWFTPHEIYGGKWWSLLAANFIHEEPLHIFFNLFWVWFLGAGMERAVGPLRYLLFVLLAGWVSASYQFTASGPGIGLSGIVYALVGFVWIAKPCYEELRSLLPDQSLKILLLWLVGCWVATEFHLAHIANEAHLFGLLFGVATAALFVRRWKPRLTGPSWALLIAGSVVFFFWAPFSLPWTAEQCERAALRGDYAAEVRWARRALHLGADPVWAWTTITYAYLRLGDQPHYQAASKRLQAVLAEHIQKQLKTGSR